MAATWIPIDVAEAVKTALAGGTFSEAFTPTRTYQPIFDLDDLADLAVTVVPAEYTEQQVARGNWQHDAQVDVAVQKKLTGTDADRDTATDGLMTLAGEIARFFRSASLTLAGGQRAVFVGLENKNPLWAQEHLIDKGLLTAVVTVSFRVTE